MSQPVPDPGPSRAVTEAFDAVLADVGIEVVKIPPQSVRTPTPNAGYAPPGPRHLRAVLDEYVSHYNEHRPHRARNLRPPDCDDIATAAVTDLTTAKTRRRKVLGGLIHEYEQAA